MSQPSTGAATVVPSRAFGTRYLGRNINHLLLSIVALVIAVWVAIELLQNPNFQWDTVAHYITAPTILSGVGTTLWLTFLVMALGLIGGVIIAVLRQSKIRVVAALAWSFIWFFRSVPMLVQLIFWYNLAALFPTLVLALPFVGEILSVSTNDVITPFVAVIIGFTLHEAAYMSEIVRSGLNAVPRGQWLAGRSLGMTEGGLFRRVVFPQVMRVIVPTLGNEAISVMKMTSLVSVIAVTDLLYSVQIIYGNNFKTIPLLIVAAIWYLLMTIVLGSLQALLEKYYGRSQRSVAALKGASA